MKFKFELAHKTRLLSINRWAFLKAIKGGITVFSIVVYSIFYCKSSDFKFEFEKVAKIYM